MFDLHTSQDFYAMLVEDFDDYMAEPQLGRRAFHVAISVYHLHEWVWGDWLKRDFEAQRRLGIRDLASFQSWIFRACVWFAFVRDIANGTKHFIRDPGFDAYRVQTLPFMFDVPGAALIRGRLMSTDV